MTQFSRSDQLYMDCAIALARSQLGRTAPNPSVGCVIVKQGRIIGVGATADSGRPHAEPQALEMCGEAASGAEVFVTLEPCAFHGQTPPCADALIAARVARVIIACEDRHPKVAGRGADMLREAGCVVQSGLREGDVAPLYAGFFKRLETGLPELRIDARQHLFDAHLDTLSGRSLEELARALAASGVNRVALLPGSEAAQALRGLQRYRFRPHPETRSR